MGGMGGGGGMGGSTLNQTRTETVARQGELHWGGVWGCVERGVVGTSPN